MAATKKAPAKKSKPSDAKVNKDAEAYGLPGEPGGPEATVPPTPGEPSTDEAPPYNPEQFAAPTGEEGPARALEPVRVEGAKAGDPVVNADAATGRLTGPEGSIRAQKVGS